MLFKNFLKSANFFFLFPIFLLGMEPSLQKSNQGSWSVVDKQENHVTLEWYKFNDYKTSFDWSEKLTPAIAQAFADESKDLRAFLLDDKLQIKKEYVHLFKDFSSEEHEELNWKISVSTLDRDSRVKAIEDRYHKQNEKAKAHLQEQDSVATCVVTAKNDKGDLLGFAIFRLSSDNASLILLGVLPSTQGRGLSRFLAFSILKIIPDIKYICLSTELWNAKAQAVYEKHLGFTRGKQNGCYVDFEYEVKK